MTKSSLNLYVGSVRDVNYDQIVADKYSVNYKNDWVILGSILYILRLAIEVNKWGNMPNYDSYSDKKRFLLDKMRRKRALNNLLISLNRKKEDLELKLPEAAFYTIKASTGVRSGYTKHYLQLDVLRNALEPIKSIYKGNTVEYYSGYGMLGIRSGNELIELMWTIVVKQEVIPYLPYFDSPNSLCQLDIPSKYLQLWVKPDIKNNYPHLYGYYKKVVKPLCEQNGIEIVEKESFKSLFQKYEIPKAKSFDGYQKLLAEEAFNRLCQNETMVLTQ